MKIYIHQKQEESTSDNIKAIATVVLILSTMIILRIAEMPCTRTVSPWLIVTTIALGVISFGCMGIVFGDEEKDEYKK
ncbi:MAG: hypothetical protein PUF37_00900 [Prevotellaceae bacterium]|nr:hypothetical protein [Prevotellaceae bacterium]